MPHRDTSVAIKQAITQALNATRDTSVAIKQAITQALNAIQDTNITIKLAITQALNAIQGHKHSYQTNYYSGSKFLTGT